MKLYIEFYFFSEGDDPIGIGRKLRDIGFEPVVGDYDLVKEYDTPAEYREIVKEVSRVLKGTQVRYRLVTRKPQMTTVTSK